MNQAASEYLALLAAIRPKLCGPAADDSIAAAIDPMDCVSAACNQAGLSQFLADASLSPTPLLIAVNDTHRFADTASALKVIENTANGGLRYRIVVSTGSHTFADPSEKTVHEQQIGANEKSCMGIEWHNAFEASNLLPLSGSTSPLFNRRLAEASHVLAIGSMEPHYFAGITGAHKTLTLGLMGYEAIAANHVHALEDEATGMKLDGNPIFEPLAQIIRDLENCGKKLFAINEVISGKSLAACYAGHPIESLRQAAPELHRIFCRRIESPQDLIISIVCPPLDRDLYQADKGIKNVECAVRNAGVIVLDAECAHGVGIDRFHRLLQRAPTCAEARQIVEKEGYRLGDHKAVRLRALTDRRMVKLAAFAPGLPESAAKDCGIHLFENRSAAVQWALAQLPPNPQALIVEDAGNITLTL